MVGIVQAFGFISICIQNVTCFKKSIQLQIVEVAHRLNSSQFHSPGMKVTNSRIAVSGLWEKLLTDKGVWGGAIVPNIIYHRLETDYNAVSRFVHLSVLESSLRARLLYQKRLLRLTAEANGGYYANLSAEYSLPGLNAAKSSAQTLLANIDYLSDSYSMVGIRLQGDYPIMKQYNLSLSVQWQAAYYKKCGTAQYAVCSLGIFF